LTWWTSHTLKRRRELRNSGFDAMIAVLVKEFKPTSAKPQKNSPERRTCRHCNTVMESRNALFRHIPACAQPPTLKSAMRTGKAQSAEMETDEAGNIVEEPTTQPAVADAAPSAFAKPPTLRSKMGTDRSVHDSQPDGTRSLCVPHAEVFGIKFPRQSDCSYDRRDHNPCGYNPRGPDRRQCLPSRHSSSGSHDKDDRVLKQATRKTIATSSPLSPSQRTCRHCHTAYPSRNRLFQHLPTCPDARGSASPYAQARSVAIEHHIRNVARSPDNPPIKIAIGEQVNKSECALQHEPKSTIKTSSTSMTASMYTTHGASFRCPSVFLRPANPSGAIKGHLINARWVPPRHGNTSELGKYESRAIMRRTTEKAFCKERNRNRAVEPARSRRHH